MGKKTSEALKQFQRDNGLAADGVAGPATQAAMAKALQAANKGDGGKGGGDPTSQTGTATLEVHVHDEQGKPVDGAKVRLSNGPTQKPDTPTNAGIARFEGLADGEYRVNAAKLNVVWEAAQVRQGKLAPGQTYVVTLNKLTKPGAAVGDLFVVVVRDDGKGEIDASVTAKPASGGQSVPGILTLGKYRFTLPAGEYRVTAFGRDGQTASISAQVDANKKNSAKIVLSSQPLGDMIVRVTLGGKSFEGADVRATPKGGGKYFGGKTDPDGKIVFLGTPAGEYTVFAADLGSGKSKTVSAQVQADETTGVDLALR
jgi:peptidoglycan hydrolase-like protein with peptidoglycan-binding domain